MVDQLSLYFLATVLASPPTRQRIRPVSRELERASRLSRALLALALHHNTTRRECTWRTVEGLFFLSSGESRTPVICVPSLCSSLLVCLGNWRAGSWFLQAGSLGSLGYFYALVMAKSQLK